MKAENIATTKNYQKDTPAANDFYKLPHTVDTTFVLDPANLIYLIPNPLNSKLAEVMNIPPSKARLLSNSSFESNNIKQ
uniref:YycH domain-containing protein n=1 Tax=Rhabditophanes sp. KR3021 TaxID=114890 RepID=A0AC35TPD8_9BILA